MYRFPVSDHVTSKFNLKNANMTKLLGVSGHWPLTLSRWWCPTSPEGDKVDRFPSPSAVRSPSCRHDSQEARDVYRSERRFLALLERYWGQRKEFQIEIKNVYLPQSISFCLATTNTLSDFLSRTNNDVKWDLYYVESDHDVLIAGNDMPMQR